MGTNRTTKSGERLTLITTIGGQPVSRSAVDRFCEKQPPIRRRRAS